MSIKPHKKGFIGRVYGVPTVIAPTRKEVMQTLIRLLEGLNDEQ
jgi:hypothetical protein